VCDDFSVVNDRDLVADFRLVHVVRREENRDVFFFLQAQNILPNVSAGLRV
jgi:hypothetical protein